LRAAAGLGGSLLIHGISHGDDRSSGSTTFWCLERSSAVEIVCDFSSSAT